MTRAKIISEIISQLSATILDNTEECEKYVSFVVNAIFPIPWLHHPLKAGTIISRCRKDAPNLGRDSFSCKPAERVEDYQRASIPHKTVFYGAVGDRGVDDGEFIAMLETSKIHRNNIEFGKEVVFHPVCLGWFFDELYSRAKIVFFSVHSTAGRGQLSNGGFSAGNSVPSASILGTCLR